MASRGQRNILTMIVSQFQIRNTTNSPRSTFYELLLTNLGDKSYQFTLVFSTETSFFQNKAAVTVTTGHSYTHKALTVLGNDRYGINTPFSVAPQDTARIRLTPFDVVDFATATDYMDSFGHVELLIPLKWTFGDKKVSQGSDQVDILLHAYTMEWTTGEPVRNAAPITLASGQAANKILPQQVFTWNADVYESSRILEYLRASSAADDFMADESKALAGLLYLLDTAPENAESIELINRLLREVELPYELHRRQAAWAGTAPVPLNADSRS